jgi:hypothetical protein
MSSFISGWLRGPRAAVASVGLVVAAAAVTFVAVASGGTHPAQPASQLVVATSSAASSATSPSSAPASASAPASNSATTAPTSGQAAPTGGPVQQHAPVQQAPAVVTTTTDPVPVVTTTAAAPPVETTTPRDQIPVVCTSYGPDGQPTPVTQAPGTYCNYPGKP